MSPLYKIPLAETEALPLLPCSGFILGSPRRVSRKREFSWIRLETFGNVRPKKFEHRSPETIGDKKSPHLAGLSHRKKEILSNAECLAGAGGFEPPHGGIKIHCLTTWRRPNSVCRKAAGLSRTLLS